MALLYSILMGVCGPFGALILMCQPTPRSCRLPRGGRASSPISYLMQGRAREGTLAVRQGLRPGQQSIVYSSST